MSPTSLRLLRRKKKGVPSQNVEMSSYRNNSKTGGRLPMTIIRQGSLFDLQELYNLEPTHRFESIFSAIDIDPIFAVVTKKSRFGRPVDN